VLPKEQELDEVMVVIVEGEPEIHIDEAGCQYVPVLQTG
jgi:hypothetical protein